MDPCAALRNSDIWHLILPLVDRKTRSALVQTCHSLNHEAAPYLLGHVVLQELDSEKLSSFVRFIAPRDDEEESAYRLRSLRGLSLGIDHTPLSLDALLALFIRLQQHATNLTRLQVTVLHAATQLSGVDSAARLGSGIGSLRYLTDLELNFHQALPYREAIQTMHSRLMTLRLGSNGQFVDLIPLLRHSRDTLETLDAPISFAPFVELSFPHMRDLTIECPGIISTAHLVKTFPSLQVLRIASYGDTAAESRLPENPFPLLRIFHGSLYELYGLGIRHRLNNLKLRVRGLMDLDRLRMVLSETSPSRLELAIGPRAARGSLENPAFVAMFSEGVVPRLRNLVLDITWGAEDEDTDINAIEVNLYFDVCPLCIDPSPRLDTCQAALKTIVWNLPLKTLKIVLQLQELRYYSEENWNIALAQDIDGWEADALADHLLDCQPSLISVSVDIASDPYTPNKATMWRPRARGG